jgi:hypothetical protein
MALFTTTRYCEKHPLFFLILNFFCVISPAHAQEVSSSAEISYSFDDHTFNERKRQTIAKPVDVSLVEDRFGNDRSAVSLNGNVNSYLNLGVSPLLRPETGTISLWISISARVYAGKGAVANPILMTKNSPGDDFYDAFALYYTGDDHSFAAVCTKDSLEEASVKSVNRVQFGKWYHLAITMDDHYLSFYVNGNLQGRSKKNFETQFLETDSLMVGHTANKKNERYTLGFVDDIRIFHRVLSDNEIKALYDAPNPNRNALILEQVAYWGGTLAGIFLVAALLVWQRRRRLKRASEQLDQKRKLHEMEIRTLKAQMNPHFIFNALNSIQVFIMQNENKKAEVYLSRFSKLIRRLVESNANESLSVREEIEILEVYLEIESLRFGNTFSYAITIDEAINPDQTMIPHMMVQPFIENAIWHGLLTKESNRKLEISLAYDSPKIVRFIIDDNGVGRLANSGKESTFKRKSLALSMVSQRLELMNTLLNVGCSVEITDKMTENGLAAGTRVVLLLPVLNN